jgi:alkylhydroperoxidase/carboxymuconolactone decarboxylase family protein YurZ
MTHYGYATGVGGDLALSVGVHSHVRQALEEGVTKEELQQVALMAITTLGFPTAMAAISWINNIVNKQE